LGCRAQPRLQGEFGKAYRQQGLEKYVEERAGQSRWIRHYVGDTSSLIKAGRKCQKKKHERASLGNNNNILNMSLDKKWSGRETEVVVSKQVIMDIFYFLHFDNFFYECGLLLS